MLKLNICFIDYSETDYTPKSIYTQPLPMPQRNALYLATALATRNHQITLLQEACSKKESHQNLHIAPTHLKPEVWAMENFDIVIVIDSVEAGVDVAPFLKPETRLILWSMQPANHIGLLGLTSPKNRNLFDKIVTTNAVLMHELQSKYNVQPEKCAYRPPAMTRTLRKRFPHQQSFLDTLPEALTLSFVQRPEEGLSQTLDMFDTLQQGFEPLKLQVLLPALESPWTPSEKALLEKCQQHPDITVYDPMPQPAYVEQLAKSHVLCAPLAFKDSTGTILLDPLATGNHCVAVLSPGLGTIGEPLAYWVDIEPAENITLRYTQMLGKVLTAWHKKPDEMIRKSLERIAILGTHFTWDLRVWEWESLLFQMIKTGPKL